MWFLNPDGSYPSVPHYTLAGAKLKVFRCPSDPDSAVRNNAFGRNPETGGTIIGLHFWHAPELGGVRLRFWYDDWAGVEQFFPLGRTNYSGVGGTGRGTVSYLKPWEGVYTNRSETTLGQLARQDGTTNTLLYGEKCGLNHQSRGPYTFDLCWFAAGALPTTWGLGRGDSAVVQQFSSNHPAGVQFCFADGSVRIVKVGDTDTVNSPDWITLQQLAGKADGSNPANSLED
jgi:prepilin-type processing-associated H-X9-DG protein